MKALSLIFFAANIIIAQTNPFVIKSSIMALPTTYYGNHGVSVIDFNKDGLDDIFFANIAQVIGNDTSWCVLLKNN